MNLLKDNICGKRLINLKKDDTALFLVLDDRSIISIYNRVGLFTEDSLLGKTITDIGCNKESFKIIFDNIEKIEVGMKDNDYNGPEAFFYHGSNGVLISG